MNKKSVLYARVSLEIQTQNDAVSIDQQIEQMQYLCQRNNWEATEVFIDHENYRATQQPKKGKIVNPSGERADRPRFLAMLETIKSGDVDIVLCWRDDRLVRHPRVAVALEDALDQGDMKRNGRPKIQVSDATGALIDRFTLSIKATIWREENKRRAERSMMGKVGTLKEGRWPGEYRRYGYKSVKVSGKRGRAIELDPETSPIVRDIFEMYDSGKTVVQIREYLINNQVPQIYLSLCKHDWSKALITRMLRSEAYLGKARWTFGDGTVFELDIPQIIEPELWQRVQKRMDRNKVLSTRNSKGVYLLQGLLKCGDCGNSMTVAREIDYSGGGYGYRCHTACHNPHEPHPNPYNHNGSKLDWAVWREIVDSGLKNPEIVREQIESRVSELQSRGEKTAAEILHIQRRLESIEGERAFYQKKAAQGIITEAEFDQRMRDTAEQIEHWTEELDRLRALMYEAERVESSLDYAEKLFSELRDRLDYLDCDPTTLARLPSEERTNILKERQKIIRLLVDKVTVNAKREVIIEGVIDGSESSNFDLRGS
jgi:site-specific DNA recombinase